MNRFLLALVLFLPLPSFAQSSVPKAQCVYMYNFAKLIEWPVSYVTGPFVIGVLGPSEVASELEAYCRDKKIGSRAIEVVRFKEPLYIENCHILFVPYTRTKQLAEVTKKLTGMNAVIITEKEGALSIGSAINFIIRGDNLSFELKSDNAQKYGVRFSKRLVELSAGPV